MEDGTLVRLRTGKIVYKAYVDRSASGWHRLYTLVPASGAGRKRYRVRHVQLRPHWDEEPKPVNTSAGKVRRPKTFSRLPEYSGCTRRTHVGPKWVFKLEKYPGGGNYKNRVEAAKYALQTGMSQERVAKKFGEDAARTAETRYGQVPIAECHLLPDGVLMMERVRPVYNLNSEEGAEQIPRDELAQLGYQRPDWASHVDCEQIGYNTKGELVAFDL